MTEPLLGIRRVLHAGNAHDTIIIPQEPIAVRGYTGGDELFRCRLDCVDGRERIGTDETFATRAYLEALPREDEPMPDDDPPTHGRQRPLPDPPSLDDAYVSHCPLSLGEWDLIHADYDRLKRGLPTQIPVTHD